MNECLQIPYVLVECRSFDFLASIKYEFINGVLGDLPGAASSYQSFEVTQGESCFIERGLLIAFDLLVMRILFSHLRLVDGHGPGKDVGVQLSIFHLAIMFGESFARQSLCLAFAALIPTHPPALNVFSFVCPGFSHNIESIVIPGGRIKRKKGLRARQNGVKIETCAETSDR